MKELTAKKDADKKILVPFAVPGKKSVMRFRERLRRTSPANLYA